MRLLALVLALAVGDPRLKTPEAQAAYEEAEAAFASEDFDAAAEALARVYAIEPLPHILYARAQAERLAGRCARASPLYIEYLDTLPSADSAALVQWNLSVCLATMSLDAGACDQAQEQIDSLRSEAGDGGVRSKQVLELEARLESCREPEPLPPPEPEPTPEPEPEPQPPPPVVIEPPTDEGPRVDAWGLVLGAGSVLCAGAAVGLYLGGNEQIDGVQFEGIHSAARQRHARGRGMQGAAIGAVAAAGSLAIGAIVHWAIWRKRRR